ncbi:MAG: DoxX family protein [Tannerellaceae bacterium]|jgi:uncharacterized membrane protein YphA (DoxX/SURF4 family)|nr:DoxX family protein [Tannerellaceae bacterium]
MIRVLAEVCRVITGAVFVFSGFVKAVDPMGFGIKLGEYLSSFGLFGLKSMAMVAAVAMITVEFTAGICVLLGAYRRWASMAVLALMCVMTPLTLYISIFNPVTDCGCFGDALVISNWETFAKTVVLLGMALFLFRNHKETGRFYSGNCRWFVPVFAAVYVAGFSMWNYYRLPCIDFRPYKVGVHIPTQMSIPEGAPTDEYEYSFIYEKDGKQQTFTLEDYPANDTSWTFIDAKSRLLKKGYTPPIASFTLLDLDANDATDRVLQYPSNLFLLILARAEEASDARTGEISRLHEYAELHGIPFYGLTGSSPTGIEHWRNLSGSEYPFLMADDVLLKTIIRSNPGFVWLHNGRIMMKRHYEDFPSVEEMAEAIAAGEPVGKGRSWIIFNLLGFSLPLLLTWIYDRATLRRKGSKHINADI